MGITESERRFYRRRWRIHLGELCQFGVRRDGREELSDVVALCLSRQKRRGQGNLKRGRWREWRCRTVEYTTEN